MRRAKIVMALPSVMHRECVINRVISKPETRAAGKFCFINTGAESEITGKIIFSSNAQFVRRQGLLEQL